MLKSRRLILIVMSISMAILAVALVLASQSRYEFLGHDAMELREGWTDEEGNPVTLPKKVSDRPDGYSIETILPQGNGTPRYFLFYAKYENVHLYYNDQEIGSCICQTPEQTRTQGRIYTFIMLPQEAGTLRIDTLPLLSDEVPYEILAPSVGAGGDVIQSMVARDVPHLIIIISIFCLGVFLLVCGLQALHVLKGEDVSRTFRLSFLYIGSFALLFSLYILFVTDTTHLFLPHPYFIYVAEFLLLPLIPLPLLALAAEMSTPGFRKLLTGNCFVVALNFVVQTVMHFCFDLELRTSVVYTHLLLVCSVILLLVAMFVAGLKKKGQWWPLVTFSPLIVGASIDIYRYYKSPFYERTIGFYMGVLVFLLLQTIVILRQNLAYYESYLRADTYRHMAYTDALTGLANRAAFEEKLHEVREKPTVYNSIWCVSADINNLKQVNDTLGHAYGDELIQAAAMLLLKAAGEKGKVYRVGGDEFIMLLFNWEEAAVHRMHAELMEAMAGYGKSHGYELSVAVGFDRFRYDGDDTMTRLMFRVDAMMYQEKRRWKKLTGES